MLLLTLLPISAMAGEILVTLPAEDTEGVVSLHAVGRTVPLKPLKRAVVLHQKNRMFAPHLTVIPAGSTVDMTNDDVVYHNVFSFSKAKTFDLGLYPYGDRKEVVFDKAGEVKIFCAVHPDMHAFILVMDTPWFQQVKGAGEARFRNIPPGRYSVRLWRKQMPQLSVTEIRVGKSGTTRVSIAENGSN